MNKHKALKALGNVLVMLIALAISTVIIAVMVGTCIWLFGEPIAIGILVVLCVVMLFFKFYNEA